ncbi:hypothetical protein [Primorskyibacter sp. 2E233]|uniref:hypothetical protein n=1 Tax=Primorskyibacter sp. 2E233 TaxID=3413431 RepID=UPI003BF42475
MTDSLEKLENKMETALHIIEPKAFIILHNWTDVLGLVWEKYYRKVQGNAKTQMLPFDRQTLLGFSETSSPCAFRSETDAFGNQTVAMTGKGLLQLLTINALENGRTSFNRFDVEKFFVDHHAHEAANFVEQTLPLIINPEAVSTLPDDPHRHRARHERGKNGSTWQRLKVIGQDEPLPEPEPLPLNGKFSLLELVEHSWQTGRLARAMDGN